jgi:WD40 repeat protein
MPHQLPLPVLSPDGKILATGDSEGRVSVWLLATGERLWELPTARDKVQALAFGNNPFSRQSEAGPAACLQLAVGSKGGRVTVWDLGRQEMRSICRGLSHYCFALAFSPDGTLLAGGAKLWDAATGEVLLHGIGGGRENAIAFSPDGRILATGGPAGFGEPGAVYVWRLGTERGILTLRGMDMAVSLVAFSPDGKLVAGLSDDWQVAIWQCETGVLVRVLDAPRGYWSDNAGLAFNHDGTQFACLTGTEAKLWDLRSGEEMRSWSMRAGSIDKLTFDPAGSLIAARIERRNGEGLPTSQTKDIVCRVRNLSVKEWRAPLVEVDDFPANVIDIALAPDGSYVVVEGNSGPDGKERAIKSFNTTNGRVLWPVTLSKTRDFACLRLDVTGRFLSYAPTDNYYPRTLVTMPLGQIVSNSETAGVLGPGAKLLAGVTRGLALFRRGSQRPLVTLGIDSLSARNDSVSFDSTGNRLAWGNTDGTVTLCDLEEVRRRLAELDMGW